MRLAFSALLVGPLLSGQSIADAVADKMLAGIDHTAWSAPYVASKDCQAWIPVQTARYAPEEWTHRCSSRADGLLQESYFYAFDGSSGPVRRRVDVRPEGAANAEITQSLARKLTARFGAPIHEPQLLGLGIFGIGPVDYWKSGTLRYLVHRSRTGVELIALDNRLFKEHERDDFISQADVLFFPDPPSRPFLQQAMGSYYLGLIDAVSKDQTSRQAIAEQVSREALNLLRVAKDSLREERATLLLAANGLVTKLSTLLDDAAAAPIRAQLAPLGVTLGPMTHDTGLAYKQDLLYRVVRDFPDTEAGQLAFLELQQRGWYIATNPGCPTNPDLFHDVIEHGEAFLAQYPATPYKKEILFTLAVANESWWSIAHAPPTDYWVADIPYPRRDSNRQQPEAARARAIAYYEQIVKLAPGSPEAASAERRLPRLKLGLDTGQRRFFCSYC
jgi:hypothetical protein